MRGLVENVIWGMRGRRLTENVRIPSYGGEGSKNCSKKPSFDI